MQHSNRYTTLGLDTFMEVRSLNGYLPGPEVICMSLDASCKGKRQQSCCVLRLASPPAQGLRDWSPPALLLEIPFTENVR